MGGNSGEEFRCTRHLCSGKGRKKEKTDKGIDMPRVRKKVVNNERRSTQPSQIEENSTENLHGLPASPSDRLRSVDGEESWEINEDRESEDDRHDDAGEDDNCVIEEDNDNLGKLAADGPKNGN